MPPTVETEPQILITQRGPLVADRSLDLSRSSGAIPRPWKTAIEKLYSWWTDPIDEEDGYAPTVRAVLAKAIRAAEVFQENKFDPPHRVVQDAGGGIIFERRTGDEVNKYHFWSDGRVEYIVMKGHTVVLRREEN